MQLVVQVTEAEAKALLRQLDGAPAADGSAAALAERAGVTLRPQQPGAGRAGPARWFLARVPDRATAQDLVTALGSAPGVEAAYVKPDEEPA